jgi:hypothetical protein
LALRERMIYIARAADLDRARDLALDRTQDDDL